jgi:hypothetical protein
MNTKTANHTHAEAGKASESTGEQKSLKRGCDHVAGKGYSFYSYITVTVV